MTRIPPGDESDEGDGGNDATTDESVADLLDELCAHLEATEELPIAREANAWLGEAQAVAADARGAPPAVIRERVAQARALLERIDDTENDAADDRVAAAEEAAAAIERRLG